MSMFFNPYSKKLMAFTLVCGVGFVSYSYLQENSTSLPEQSANTTPQIELDKPPETTKPTSLTTLPGVEKTQEGFDFDDEIKTRLHEISLIYAEEIKYPDYSMPIRPGELEFKYLPDAPVANVLPAVINDPKSPQLSVLPNKFRYFPGDELIASAQIIGLDQDEPSTVTARLMLNNELLATATVMPDGEAVHSYFLEFGHIQLDDIDWKENITIFTDFMFSGHTYTKTMTMEYLETVAGLEDVAPSEVKDEYLQIPVYVSTEKPGFHQIQANLYDAKTNTPLIHLRAEEELSSQSGTLTLQAHIVALKEAGSEGPYELRDIVLKRMPSDPEFITEYGTVHQDSFSVDGFGFDDYLDKPYVNEKAQRIAQELRHFGS